MGRVSPAPLIIIGAGGFGREVLGLVRDIQRVHPDTLDFLGFVDDGDVSEDLMARCGARFLGTTKMLRELPGGTHYVVAIGTGSVRRTLSAKADEAGLTPHTLIHPSVSVGVDVSIGEGTVICAGARISSNLRLGRHVNVNPNCAIGHDSTLADFVTVYPLCSVSGYVTLGETATIGATSVINPSVTVGAGAYIGSGASVTSDVPDFALAAGVPAKVKKYLDKAE